jgi:hypothetical protein
MREQIVRRKLVIAAGSARAVGWASVRRSAGE